VSCTVFVKFFKPKPISSHKKGFLKRLQGGRSCGGDALLLSIGAAGNRGNVGLESHPVCDELQQCAVLAARREHARVVAAEPHARHVACVAFVGTERRVVSHLPRS
jgi:hypothetical protein